MKLINRLFGARMHPRWEVTPGATLWKLEITNAGRLVGEARNIDTKRMSLFAIDLDSGSLLFSGCELDEPWWAALDNVIGEIAIVHRYPKPDMPNVLGTWAIDAASGAVLWHDATLRILCGTREILLAQRGASHDAPRLVFVDAQTGVELEEADEDRAALFQQSCGDDDRWSGWTSSEELSEDDPRVHALKTLMGGAPEERRGPIETATHGGYTVVSSYVRSRHSADAMLQGQLDNVLLVAHDDRVVYRETIASRLPAPTSDSFFLRSGILYFVRNGQTLVAIDLNDAPK